MEGRHRRSAQGREDIEGCVSNPPLVLPLLSSLHILTISVFLGFMQSRQWSCKSRSSTGARYSSFSSRLGPA